MKALKVILNGKEFILPEENDGMLEVRGIAYERVEVEYTQHIMEDIVNERN